jgi:hypothetical protein
MVFLHKNGLYRSTLLPYKLSKVKRKNPIPLAPAPRDPLHESSGKWALRIGMGCKAQNAAIAVAIASICNAADRPRPQMHTAR